MPKVGLSLGSSFEKLFNKTPDPSKLRVFGCLCFPWLYPYSSHKLDPNFSPCVFLDYSLTQSVFFCFDPTLKKTFVSRHVKFVENYSRLCLSTSAAPVIDTNSTLLASSFLSCNYPTSRPPSPSPYLYPRSHPNCCIHPHHPTRPPI